MITPANPLGFGLHHDVRAETYHTDMLMAEPTLSRGEMLCLVDESPLHCYLSHPRLSGGVPDAPNAKMNFGSLGHRLILDKGDPIMVIEADDWKTKAARELKAQALSEHKIPALTKDYERGKSLAKSFPLELERFGLLEKWLLGKSEVVALWDEGGGCACRCMFDRLVIDETAESALFMDVKISDEINPSSIAKHIFNQNYHVQDAHYTHGLEAVLPRYGGRIKSLFLFISANPPHTMVPVELNGEFKMLGISKTMRAIDLWKKCRASGIWPPYTDTVIRVEPPTWALNQEIGK